MNQRRREIVAKLREEGRQAALAGKHMQTCPHRYADALQWHIGHAAGVKELAQKGHDETTLESWAEEACDQLDAGFFSGDTFRSPTALARIRYYMARWERQCVEIEQELKG